MKRKIILIMAFVLFFLVSCTAQVTDSLEDDELTNPTEEETNHQTKGVWWWSDALDATTGLDFCEEKGINEVYYATTRFDSSTLEFITLAKSQGIEVYLLAGEKEWILDARTLQGLIDAYIEFQNQYDSPFSGIHLDIEPHQFGDFSLQRTFYLSKFIELVGSLKETYSIPFDYDIPFWLDDEMQYQQETKSAYKHIIDLCNRAFIMSYRDTQDGIYSVSEEEIEYANSINKTIVLSVETKSSEGDQVSFQEEGSIVMEEILQKIVSDGYSTSVHWIKSWMEMKENPSYVQNISLEENITSFSNPDQGFYYPMVVKVTDTGITYPSWVIKDERQLYHLRIDISAFSSANNNQADKPLTQEALDGLKNLFQQINDNGQNAILRFCYDENFDGNIDKEPSMEMMIQHISQIGILVQGFESMITAIEVGLVGPWGEMHSSSIATYENIKILTETYLNVTKKIPILVRTPKMIYTYLGITVDDLDTYEMPKEVKRLGLFNDGYLGSDTDLGTYTDREKEIQWLSNNIAYLPFGGEVVRPTSELHDIDVCVPEMFLMHLSYLNIEWNDTVIQKWKDTLYTASSGTDEAYYGQTAFTYILNHMGYRFMVKESVLSYGSTMDNLDIHLEIENIGFGNLTKEKDLVLYVVKEDGTYETISIGKYFNEETLDFSIKTNLTKGMKLYLGLSNDDKYSIQFANQDIWNETLQANFIGEIQ